MRIGIDAMGGDFAPDAAVKGAVLALREFSEDARIVLIGNKDAILPVLKSEKTDPASFDIVHAPDVIEMAEHPTKALPKKPDSSISLGLRLLKSKEIDVFAGAGNTGAMFVGSMFTVRSIAGVIRPCITSIMPKENNKVGIILDVGANADCKPDVLCQFGTLGSIYANLVYGIKNPRVGLLNIGEEAEKGNIVCRATYELMKEATDFHFIGNIEGRDILNDKSDVIVCDGFIGNIVLKQAESFYHFAIKRGISDEYFDRFNYENYGGTPILGINSNVIIGHGISNSTAIMNMLKLSKEVVDVKLSEQIQKAFA